MRCRALEQGSALSGTFGQCSSSPPPDPLSGIKLGWPPGSAWQAAPPCQRWAPQTANARRAAAATGTMAGVGSQEVPVKTCRSHPAPSVPCLPGIPACAPVPWKGASQGTAPLALPLERASLDGCKVG